MPGPLLIKNAVAVLPGGPARTDLLCEHGRIVAIGAGIASRDTPVLDAGGLTLGPGFVDIHVHGGGGHSFAGADPDALAAYATWAPRVGVTSFLASTFEPCLDDTAQMLAACAPAVGPAPGRAELLGLHLEGPFLNPLRCGAFHPDSLRDACREEYWRLQEEAGGTLRVVTFAPELTGGIELAAAILASGAVAAMGHTDADVGEARRGFEAGVRHVTHLFNAMRPLHHRDGGAAAAALLEDAVTCEVIADGHHVSPEMLRLAYRVLGPQRMVVVTDNLDIAGASVLDTSFGGGLVDASGGVAVRQDGTIVGSIATMDQQFRTICREADASLGAAFRMCSANPARVVGEGSRKGSLQGGYDADLVLLDQDLGVVATVCGGEVAYLTDQGRAPWASAAA